MHESAQILEKPQGNPKIWRYLDFTKFISMLDRNALIFIRVDKLDDPFEGSYSKPTINATRAGYIEQSGMCEKEISNVFKKFREHAFVNCWHINEVESAAMWRLYLKSGEGVAIQSRYRKLKDNLPDSVSIGQVDYIDYSNDIMVSGNPIFAYFYKRKSFEYERELRAACLRLPKEDGGYLNIPTLSDEECELNLNKKSLDYLAVSMDLNKLVDRIYVSPLAEEWFTELVGSVMRKYGLNKKVIQSRLNIDPIF